MNQHHAYSIKETDESLYVNTKLHTYILWQITSTAPVTDNELLNAVAQEIILS